MSKLAPSISVVMSVYNGANYLQESVESILAQTFTNFEFIIINDGSTDNTWEILTKYADQDKRIILIQNKENIGLTKSLNKGIELAHGEYVARQDADDISLPERFEKQVVLLEHPEIVLVSCNLESINSEGHSTGKLERACDRDLVPWYLLFYNRLAGHSQVVFKRETIRSLGGYCENRRYSQDYELWCRLGKVGKIAVLPEVLLQQRIHSKSISVEKGSEQKAYSLNQVRHNIKQLIGKEISLEEAEDLRCFWVGHWGKQFPDSEKVGTLHSRLNEIYRMFLQQNTHQNFPSLKISRRLRILIGQQFIHWIRFLPTRHNLLAKIKISVYAFVWHPLGVLDYWLKQFWNVQLRILRTLVRRNYKKDLQNNSIDFPHKSS